MNTVYHAARSFIYRHARPLDFARFRFHFEGGSREDVLRALAAYQNEDGGFGHALEADYWNPASTPIAAWTATCILREIGMDDAQHPIIKGLLRYLESGADFENGMWYNTVRSNSDHPHAVWWTCSGGKGEPHINPTASLAGFALRYANPGSALRSTAEAIAQRIVPAFIAASDEKDEHNLICYCDLLGHLEASRPVAGVDLNAFREALHRAVCQTICKEPEKWFTEYVCKPSKFLAALPGFSAIVPRDLCLLEADMLAKVQGADGAWPVTWEWHTPYKEYYISADWWRSVIILENLLFLQSLGMLEDAQNA